MKIIQYINRCQFFLYVTLSFSINAYSSDLIELESGQIKIKTYYPKHLTNLREAVKPRIINYIGARNYRLYGKLNVKGILFTHKNRKAKKIYLVSELDGYKKHAMARNKKGVWYYILEPPLYNAKAYKTKVSYKYWVDGLYAFDANAPQENNASVFYLLSDDILPKTGATILNTKVPYGHEVLFRIHAPKANGVLLLGNFNRWNGALDVLKRTDRGYYELRRVLPPGPILYQFKVDDKVILDTKNAELKAHPIHGRASYIEIPQ